MKISELLATIESYQKLHPGQDLEVVINLDIPSVGSRASCGVTSASIGFDWESGQFRLKADCAISPKSENESIFEAGRDLLGWIATKPTKKQSYEQRTALSIFKRLNYDIMKFQKIFHHDVK